LAGTNPSLVAPDHRALVSSQVSPSPGEYPSEQIEAMRVYESSCGSNQWIAGA
jgi:hypothetical protein